MRWEYENIFRRRVTGPTALHVTRKWYSIAKCSPSIIDVYNTISVLAVIVQVALSVSGRSEVLAT